MRYLNGDNSLSFSSALIGWKSLNLVRKSACTWIWPQESVAGTHPMCPSARLMATSGGSFLTPRAAGFTTTTLLAALPCGTDLRVQILSLCLSSRPWNAALRASARLMGVLGKGYIGLSPQGVKIDTPLYHPWSRTLKSQNVPAKSLNNKKWTTDRNQTSTALIAAKNHSGRPLGFLRMLSWVQPLWFLRLNWP